MAKRELTFIFLFFCRLFLFRTLWTRFFDRGRNKVIPNKRGEYYLGSTIPTVDNQCYLLDFVLLLGSFFFCSYLTMVRIRSFLTIGESTILEENGQSIHTKEDNQIFLFPFYKGAEDE